MATSTGHASKEDTASSVCTGTRVQLGLWLENAYVFIGCSFGLPILFDYEFLVLGLLLCIFVFKDIRKLKNCFYLFHFFSMKQEQFCLLIENILVEKMFFIYYYTFHSWKERKRPIRYYAYYFIAVLWEVQFLLSFLNCILIILMKFVMEVCLVLSTYWKLQI